MSIIIVFAFLTSLFDEIKWTKNDTPKKNQSCKIKMAAAISKQKIQIIQQSCATAASVVTSVSPETPLIKLVTFAEYCDDDGFLTHHTEGNGAMYLGQLVQKKSEQQDSSGVYGIIEQIFDEECKSPNDITCVVAWNQPNAQPEIVSVGDLQTYDLMAAPHKLLYGTRVLCFVKYGRVMLEQSPKQYGTMVAEKDQRGFVDIKFDDKDEYETHKYDELLYLRQDGDVPKNGQLVCLGINENGNDLNHILFRKVRHRQDIDKVGILANYSKQYGFHVIFDSHHLRESWSRVCDNEYIFISLDKMRYYGPKANEAVSLPRFGNAWNPEQTGIDQLLGHRIENVKSNNFGTVVEVRPGSLDDYLFGVWWDDPEFNHICMLNESELCITCRFRPTNNKIPRPGSVVAGCPNYGARVSIQGPHKAMYVSPEYLGTIIEVNTLDKKVSVVLDSHDKITQFSIGHNKRYNLVYAKHISQTKPKLGQFVASGMLGMMVSRNLLSKIHDPVGWGTIYKTEKLYFYVIWHGSHQSEKIHEWKYRTQTTLTEGAILRYVWPLLHTQAEEQ